MMDVLAFSLIGAGTKLLLLYGLLEIVRLSGVGDVDS